MDLNTSRFSGCRRYKPEFPHYLHDRPRAFIGHCMGMKASAEDSSQQITQSSSAVLAFTVGAKNKTNVHDVFMGDETTLPRCTCNNFREQSGHINISLEFLSTSQSEASIVYLSNMLKTHSLRWMDVFCFPSLQVPPYLQKTSISRNRLRT